MQGEHDLDPYERQQKELLATFLTPFLFRSWREKKNLVLMSCSTAYFERCLLSVGDFSFRRLFIVEDPGLSPVEREAITNLWYEEDDYPDVRVLPGNVETLRELSQTLIAEDTCCLGLNVNIYEPLHLFHDFLDLFPCSYLLISQPYMDASQPLYTATDLGGTLPPPFVAVDPDLFFKVSGLEDEYQWQQRGLALMKN